MHRRQTEIGTPERCYSRLRQALRSSHPYNEVVAKLIMAIENNYEVGRCG